MSGITDQSSLLNMQYVILGTMMRNPSTVGAALAKLSRDNFTTISTRALFDTISSLHTSNSPIEITAIRQCLGEEYDPLLESAWELATDGVEWYIDQLLQCSRISAIHAAAYQVAACDTLDEMQKSLDALNSVAVHGKKARVFSAADMASIMLDQLEEETAPVIFRTGIPQLDECVSIKAGQLVILGGYPSAGKTALSLQMAIHMAKTKRVGFYSLETDEEEAAQRFLSFLASIPSKNTLLRKFEENQYTDAARAANYMSTLNLDFIPASNLSTSDIKSLALAYKHEVIFVDYLQIVNEKAANRYEVVTNISQDLHRLALDAKIAVIALAQLSRSKDKEGNPVPPNMQSLRESGQIEQDANIILLLYLSDPDNYRSSRYLKVAKNKLGEKAKLELDFDGKTQRFSVVSAEGVSSTSEPPTIKTIVEDNYTGKSRYSVTFQDRALKVFARNKDCARYYAAQHWGLNHMCKEFLDNCQVIKS